MKKIILIVCLMLSQCVAAKPGSTKFDQHQLHAHLYDNIATQTHTFTKHDGQFEIHSLPGAVLASPSRFEGAFEQDYQFHWMRDAAIVMRHLVKDYQRASESGREKIKPYLKNYIAFERIAKAQRSKPGEETTGQPKFNLNATVWEGVWGRPQNDGPALRALAMTEIAELMLAEGDVDEVEHMLDLIKDDLDFVATHWYRSSFGLWEEVNDTDHFFNKMVQRKSLVVGAKLFSSMQKSNGVADWHRAADKITASLEKHWNADRGYITETLNKRDQQGGGLNSSIILAALYGSLDDAQDGFAINNDRIMSTVAYLRAAFANLYDINIKHSTLAPLIGRYPSDIYDGQKNAYGNPWFLLTAVLADYYYQLAEFYERTDKIAITETSLEFFKQLKSGANIKAGLVTRNTHPVQFPVLVSALKKQGDELMTRISGLTNCYHGSCMHMAEQIDRKSGKQASAKDLSWSYVAVLDALRQ